MEGKLKIVIASDHGGYSLKAPLIEFVESLGHEVRDLGTDCSEVSVNYPDYAKMAAMEVLSGTCDKGILICGTGQGIGISANKVRGIRCAVLSDCYSAKMAARHNNCNMIALGARVTGQDLAKEIVKSFLEAEFEGGRHQMRVELIGEIENNR